MVPVMHEVLFHRLFDIYESDTHNTSFFDKLDLSQYSALTVIQAVAADNVDAYLKATYSRRYLQHEWCRYITWNKEEEHYIIDPEFYEQFSAALCAALTSAEAVFKLAELDFMDMPEVIETVHEYAEKYKKTEHGDDTIKNATHDDYREDDIKQRHSKREEDIKQRHTKKEPDITQHQTTTENTKSAFNSNQYQPLDKSVVTEAAYKDKIDVTEDAHKDQIDVTDDAHKDKITYHYDGYDDTKEYGDIEVTEREHTDTDTVTKTGVLPKEKLYEILKELAQVNAYKVVGDAIVSTLLRPDYDAFLDHAGVWFSV